MTSAPSDSGIIKPATAIKLDGLEDGALSPSACEGALQDIS